MVDIPVLKLVYVLKGCVGSRGAELLNHAIGIISRPISKVSMKSKRDLYAPKCCAANGGRENEA